MNANLTDFGDVLRALQAFHVQYSSPKKGLNALAEWQVYATR